jgi:hypothetical protein
MKPWINLEDVYIKAYSQDEYHELQEKHNIIT